MSDQAGRRGLTRRQVLRGAGGAAAVALTGGVAVGVVRGTRTLPEIASFGADPADGVQAFRSRPGLRPPTVTTSTRPSGHPPDDLDAGFLFLGPGPVSLKGAEQYGPLIVDRTGVPIWFRPVAKGLEVTNFSVTQYRGDPTLAWWEGKILPTGYGQGEAVLVNRSYREVARVRAAGGRSMDLHALTVTPQGTALFTCYPETVAADLSSIGGPSDSHVLESIIQEVDIASGRLLFEWRGLQHIPLSASYEPLGEPYDYLHVNSIQPLPDGNLLVSARHTWAIYKLDRRTGAVIWTLGGKGSRFVMGSGTQTAWQHDARQISDGTLTVFDNGTNGPNKTEHESRGLMLNVDESRRRVSLHTAYTSPARLSVGAMGSVQVLPSGRVLVGWGVDSHSTAFGADGAPLLDFALPGGTYSYRAQWLPWQGAPHHRPAVATSRDPQSGAAIVYASWNGATEVSRWQVQAGPAHDQLRPVGAATRRGFETVIPLRSAGGYARVTALDISGRRLKHSPVIKL